MSTDLPKPDYARNMRILAHCDQGGRPDGVQIMVHRGYAYVGHMFSKGFSVIDVRDPRRPRANPVSIATFPTPGEADYVRKGGHFGPHNIHENRPGSFVSSQLIFATYQNAGVRVFDDLKRPRPRVFHGVAQTVQRTNSRIPAPGENQFTRGAHADHLVIYQVRRHAN